MDIIFKQLVAMKNGIYTKKAATAIVFYVLLLSFMFGQTSNAPLSLTKDQMYEDFDEFISILQDANPQLPIRKAVTGIDHLAQAKSLRSAIDTLENYYRFINLLENTLGCMFDGHARMADQIYEHEKNIEGIDANIIPTIASGDNQWAYSEPYRTRWFPCNPSYINGDYYLHGNYFLIDKENPDDTVFLRRAKILSYNNQPYQDYVMKRSRFFSNGMHWDFQRKQYYCKTSVFPIDNKGLTVENLNGEVISLELNRYNSIAHQRDDMSLSSNPDFQVINIQSFRKKVLYFQEDKILYIYSNLMPADENELANEIKAIGNGKEINKVIIDVRGNRGGNDLAWHQLLKALVADTLIYDVQMAFCHSELMNKRLDKQFTDPNAVELKTFDWLPDVTFSVTKFAPSYFIPDSNSLKYKGKIYVLQNEDVYSAGHSFTTYCHHIEQLVSVGIPTGFLAGFGLMPMLYQLKHSKFSFRLEPAIDVTRVNKVEDVYQDIPEILIEIPFDEQIKILDYRFYDMQNEKCLYTYDYLFKKVLEME
jgi:hypothetical protein